MHGKALSKAVSTWRLRLAPRLLAAFVLVYVVLGCVFLAASVVVLLASPIDPTRLTLLVGLAGATGSLVRTSVELLNAPRSRVKDTRAALRALIAGPVGAVAAVIA